MKVDICIGKSQRGKRICGVMVEIIREECLMAVYALLTLITCFTPGIKILRDMSSHGKTIAKETVSASTENNMPVLLARIISRSLLPKQWFLHFYIIGISSSVAVATHYSASLRPELLVPLLVQVSRRCYECLYVHAWRSDSQMHLAAYAIGILHYSILPFNFVETDPDDFHAVFRIMGVLVCLYGQYEQDVHHRIMARLRVESPKHQRYVLPKGRLFKWIGSPQYLAEIVVYVGFFLILQRKSAAVLLLWVTSNQIVGALATHQWYMKHFEEYKKENRKALIPYLF